MTTQANDGEQSQEVEIEIDQASPTGVEAEDPEGDAEGEEEKHFDPAKDRVEINDPNVQAKFNHMYKQVKMSDQRNSLYWNMLQKQNEKIEQFEKRFTQTDTAEAVTQLQSRLQEARDEGDIAKETKVLGELMELNQTKTAALPKKSQEQLLAEADPETRYLVNYMQETDTSGNLLRPWIRNDHPQHQDATKLAGVYAAEVNAELGFVDIEEIMNRVEKAMTKKTKSAPSNSRAPDPMRGNLTNNQAKGKIRLSQQELAMAKRLNLSPAEYENGKIRVGYGKQARS